MRSQLFLETYNMCLGLPGGTKVKNPPANCKRCNPESGRFPGGGSGNPLQYYSLENSMDRGA